MKMKNLFVIVMMTIASSVSAQTVTEEQAFAKAKNFFATKTNLHLKKTADKSLKLSYTAVEKNTNAPLYYAFNNGNEDGFVVVSGDEKAEEILMYSYEGSFDISTVNPNLRYWLGELERQITYVKANNIDVSRNDSKAAPARVDVPVLVQTRWDQSAPYNNMCPLDNSNKKRCLTGCVATAMSQIMKTHEWPLTGIGSHSYTDFYDSDYGYGSNKTLTADFYTHTYDWNNMLNTYGSSSSYSSQQGDAVALLMSDVGISVEMGYGNSTQGGSAAYTEFCPYAFVNYFGYDKGVTHLYRDYYSDEEWDEMIYSELAKGRPVMYGGCSSSYGGHSFVCDGYQASTGKYHFNWGWSGSGDCYCALSAVKGGGYTYDYYQDIIVGLQKPVAGNVSKPNIVIYDDCSLKYTTTESNGLTTYNVNFGVYSDSGIKFNGFIYNDAWDTFDVMFTMKYTNQETGKVFYAAYPEGSNPQAVKFKTSYIDYEYENSFEKLTIANVLEPVLPAGTYHVSLAYKQISDKDNSDESLWNEVRATKSAKNYMVLTVENTLEAPKAENASEVNNYSFTANWNEVEEAESYTLEVTETEKDSKLETIIDEDFSGFASFKSDGTEDISGKLDDYMQDTGWTGYAIYGSASSIKGGSSKKAWSLSTPSFLSSGDVTMTIKSREYGDGRVEMTAALVDESGNTVESKDVTTTENNDDIIISFKNSQPGNRICLTAKSAKKRLYISSIKIETVASGSTTHTITGITDTKYIYEDIDMDKYDYTYRVCAITPEGVTPWSNDIKVAFAMGIPTFKYSQTSEKTYDLSGKTTEKSTKGIIIKGNKKYMK